MGREDRVWTRERARREGVPRARLTGGREFVRVVPGVYVEACWGEDLLTRAAAVLHRTPSGVLSHWTALVAHGLPVPTSATTVVHVTVPPAGPRPRWPGVTAHRSRCTVFQVDGLRVSGAVRAWCDAAALVGATTPAGGRERPDVADLVAAGDALLARRPGTRVDVRNQLSLRPGGRGTAVAEHAVRLLDARAESPPESRLRLVLHLAGLTPVVQHEVREASGRLVARVDLAYPGSRVAVEYDGDHHRDRRQWRQDLARRERLEALGWRVLVVVAADLLRDPASVVARVAATLASRTATAL